MGKSICQKKYKFIEPAKIHKSKRAEMHDRIIKEFFESKLDSVKVTYEKNRKTLSFGLRSTIKIRQLKNKVRVRKVGDSVCPIRIE